MKILFIESKQLNEDKQIKLGGEVSPKYGWAVIYAGGPASGKSTATGLNLPFVGKKVDADEFKSIVDKVSVKRKDGTTELIKKPGFVKRFHYTDENGNDVSLYDKILNSPEIGGDESKMTLNDADYVKVAHRETEKIVDKVKGNMMSSGKSNKQERLPNLIFDQTSKKPDKLYRQMLALKEQGYKTALIYVLTEMDKTRAAFDSRNATGRKVDDSIFFDIHPKVLDTMKKICKEPRFKDVLDEFWVVFNKYDGANSKEGKYDMIKDTNVYHVPIEENGLESTHLIDRQGNELDTTLMDIISKNEKFFK